ncbi:MAG: rRNA maturation RNase YbeY [Lentisphaeraceae bacterium]|nr:rRNA maturation RNase YbeY [Lentisphaeraceae bacterium]
MNICFAKRTRKYPLKNRGKLLRAIKEIAKISGLPSLLPVKETELAVILVDDEEITQINETFLKHQGPTDVISFDYIEDFSLDEFDPEDPFTVGELYISLDTAEKQGREYGKSLNDELLLYIAHGILHLCGFDDHNEKDIKAMRAAETKVLNSLSKEMGAFEVI